MVMRTMGSSRNRDHGRMGWSRSHASIWLKGTVSVGPGFKAMIVWRKTRDWTACQNVALIENLWMLMRISGGRVASRGIPQERAMTSMCLVWSIDTGGTASLVRAREDAGLLQAAATHTRSFRSSISMP